MTHHILLVEDDPVLKANFTELLEMEGFRVAARDGVDAALAAFESDTPDLAILDITLGDDARAGFELCRALRQRSARLPIIFFTSHDNDIDRITGLELGVDDYLTKDTNMDYLLVRIKVLLKRIEILTGESRALDNGALRVVGDLRLDIDRLSASWMNQPLGLSLSQFWMLDRLLDPPGQVCSPAQLMDAARLTVQTNTIAAHIKNIRARFRDIDPDFDRIKTERGIGYRWLVSM